MKRRSFGLSRLETALVSPEMTLASGEVLFNVLGLRDQAVDTALGSVRRILVVRLDEIGDLVLFSPFLRELRRNCPAAWITLIVKPGVYDLVERCPHVNEVLTFDWRMNGNRCDRLVLHCRALMMAARRLWPRRFDLAINPRRDIDRYHTNFLAYLSSAPRRIGYGTNGRKRNRLLTAEYSNDPAQHEVKHNLEMLQFLGGTIWDDSLELWLSAEDERAAEELLRSRGVTHGESLVVLAPGAGAPARMWPVARFRELAERIHATTGIRSVVIGAGGETLLGKHIAEYLGDRVIDLTGATTLRQTAAVIQRCALFVGNDSGPMHLAAAVRTPIVELSSFPRDGSPAHVNSPVRFAPWGVPAKILQPACALSPCSKVCQARDAHCITQIRVEQAEDAVLALIKSVA